MMVMMDYRIEQLRFQLREDPASRVFYQLGELLRRKGDREEAIEVLREGLEHHPEYVAAWVSLGRTLFEVERYAESAGALETALDLDPENAVAAQMLGRCGARRGDWEQAVRGFSLAVELIPGDEELEAELEAARVHLAPAGPPEAGTGPTDETGVEAAVPVLPADEGPSPEPSGGADEPEEPAFSPPVEVRRPREVVVVSEEDPFTAGPRGDTGVFLVGGDVFSTGEAEEDEPESGPEAVFGGGGPTQPIPVPPEVAAGEGPTGGESETTGGLEPEPELPLPTVTLARLALEQGDLALAEETVRAVLDRDPDSGEARDLLEEIVRRREAGPRSGRAARIQRLERWLKGIRRAAEMRSR